MTQTRQILISNKIPPGKCEKPLAFFAIIYQITPAKQKYTKFWLWLALLDNLNCNKIKHYWLEIIQWNLSIADMLYSGHLSIAETFFRNHLYQATVKLLYFEPLYGEHLSITDTFSKNQWCPLFERFHCFWKTKLKS